MLKKMLAAPVMGLLFVVFLPTIGFVLVAAELSRRALESLGELAGRIGRWAELS
jgi:hypothetical protein